ncbi:unnamed protein product, partial [Closterium sp. NIES-54]
ELNGNRFSGSIPPAIFTLTQVTILGMRSNALTGDIPASIGSLASILVLDLSDNSLTGTVPAVMGKLAKLDEINVNSTGPSKVLCAAAGVCVVNQVATSAFCKKCTTFCKVCTPPGNNTNPAAVPTPAVPVPPVPAPTATPPVASPPPPAPSPTTAAPPPAPVTAFPSTPTASPPPPAAAPGAPAATVPSSPPPRAGAIYGVGFGTLLASLVSAMALDLLLATKIGVGGARAASVGGAGVTAGAGGTGGTAATCPGGARTRGTGAAGTGGVEGARAGDPTEPGAAGAGGTGTGGAGAARAGARQPWMPRWHPGNPQAPTSSSQRQGVEYFQTFSPTPKMTTLQVLLHVALQRDYELHSLDFSTAFIQGSLDEEIWLRRPPGFTGSFPAGTQWSLRQPVYGLRQAPREWHDTLRTTLAALGFAPASADPSLFLRTDTLLPPFYVLEYVDDLVFATTDTEALTLVKSELQERHTCTDRGELRSYLGLQITRDRARRTITLIQSHMVLQVLQRFGFQFSSPQPTPLSTSHSLSAPPSDESVEPSGPYPEPMGCLMYLMTCTRLDLAYPLSLLARYVALGRHRKVHWDAAKRVLRYLCSTSGMGLVL